MSQPTASNYGSLQTSGPAGGVPVPSMKRRPSVQQAKRSNFVGDGLTEVTSTVYSVDSCEHTNVSLQNLVAYLREVDQRQKARPKGQPAIVHWIDVQGQDTQCASGFGVVELRRGCAWSGPWG